MRTTYGDDVGTPSTGTTDTGGVLTAGGGPTGPGPGSDGGGIDFSSGSTNPYLPVVSPTPTTGGTSSTSTGTTHTGSTSTSSSTGSRHTTSSSTASSSTNLSKYVPSPSSTVAGSSSGSTRTVTTILTPHPVRVKYRATNDPGFPGGLPLTFIAAAGITSHERRSHHASAPHINPHRRF